MKQCTDIIEGVRVAAAKRILFLPHAVRQMSRPERMISPAEIRIILAQGVMVEDYPEDSRGHSCLLLGHGHDGRAVHVVCSPKEDYLAIVTAYLPSSDIWEGDNMRRVKR